mmetsp:Transcript_19120/g.52459  ORF Transcript_19120/g.52459 Transcript_19120/m.52459 type:complete len:567 (+) Transcript_19120:243-1943(+)
MSSYSSAYQDLVDAVIRPPRAEYSTRDLGPSSFDFFGHPYVRSDTSLRTERGLTLECSHWGPAEIVLPSSKSEENDRDDDHDDEEQQSTSQQPQQQQQPKQLPCVIYMHGNSSCRLEVLPQLTHLLAMGTSVVAFDFCGSGHSQGQHVSLGYFEAQDLQTVVQHLRQQQTVSSIALWGRSMGAATALLFAGNSSKYDPSLIAGMVLDSSFADLTQLFREMVGRVRSNTCSLSRLPMNLMLSIALRAIQRSIQKQAGFSPRHVSPIVHAPHCFVPAMFVAAEQDVMIPPETHAQPLSEHYAGDKNLVLLQDCDHNAPRPKFLLDSACFFLQQCLQLNELSSSSSPVADNIPMDMDMSHLPWRYTGDWTHYQDHHPQLLPEDFLLQDITNLPSPEQPAIIDSYAPEQSHGPLRIVGCADGPIKDDDDDDEDDINTEYAVHYHTQRRQQQQQQQIDDDDDDQRPDLLQAQHIVGSGSTDPDAPHADDPTLYKSQIGEEPNPQKVSPPPPPIQEEDVPHIDPPPDVVVPTPPAAATPSSAQAAYNHETMGMTANRQRDIESSILKMVGKE